jgi:hypothetical protein
VIAFDSKTHHYGYGSEYTHRQHRVAHEDEWNHYREYGQKDTEENQKRDFSMCIGRVQYVIAKVRGDSWLRCV